MAAENFIDIAYIVAQENDLNDDILQAESGMVNQLIEQAMFDDVKDRIGERLFYDLYNNPTETARGSYPDLLNGLDAYEDNGFNYYSFRGVKYLTYLFFMLRYRFWSQDTATAHGHGTILGDNIAQSSDDRNKEVAAEYRKQADRVYAEIVLYLDRKIDEYDEWIGGDPRIDNEPFSIVINKVPLR